MNFVKKYSKRLLIGIGIVVAALLLIWLFTTVYDFIASIPDKWNTMNEELHAKQYNKYKNAELISCGGYVIDNPIVYQNKIVSNKKVYDFYDCDVIDK